LLSFSREKLNITNMIRQEYSVRRSIGILLLPAFIISSCYSQEVSTRISLTDNLKIFTLDNEKLTCKIILENNRLTRDSLVGNPAWLHLYGNSSFALSTDANFALQFVWTDWQAPGMVNNAENPVVLNSRNFVLSEGKPVHLENGSAGFIITFKGIDIPILLTVTYRLDPGSFCIRRKIAVQDTSYGFHFLEKISVLDATVSGTMYEGRIPGTIIKPGGFGQPVGIRYPGTGSFFGIEYPAAVNSGSVVPGGDMRIDCSQDFGEKVGKDPVETDWMVEALVPSIHVKDWFFQYLDDIRVAPARPYTLYNSWYDLRSPEYPKIDPGHVMNQKNVLNIIRLFKKNMVDRHKIKLDAFVLDDGWDVYESDWVLRKETFPKGLKPISDTLKQMGTCLGAWFGPTGGYSFRMKRINWMRDHGYETVGKGRDYEMLCLGGTKYSRLFQKRVLDFTTLEGVSYFKWDGIQFSCSEPGHGHPVGIYSRKAILESLASICSAVRKQNPRAYLNITSGTWLSPWWTRYANQVWMQGEDYGYADVPSISQRDAAMTYKDFVLYDDLVKKDLWFPVSNLMTHGIIKGKLESLGGQDDPLDKFTNDVVFYLTRGISMYELYVSPDLLSDPEWDAIGNSVNWAKDRYDILSNTYMTGGDPTQREAYGYVHFKGNHGIVAIRNPYITPTAIKVLLSEEFGLDPRSSNLVIEKVYPYHWISPRLYASGVSLELPLDGYETAIYEIYPLQEARTPLPAGVRFAVTGISENTYDIAVFDAPLGVKILNPLMIRETRQDPGPDYVAPAPPALKREVTPEALGSGSEFKVKMELDPSVKEARFAVLLKPSKEFSTKDLPSFTFFMDGKEIKPMVEKQDGLWAWSSVILPQTTRDVKAKLTTPSKSGNWKGTATLYLVCQQKEEGKKISYTTPGPIPATPMLPSPFAEGIVEKTIPLGEIGLEVK
jgi:hypothetical protein